MRASGSGYWMALGPMLEVACLPDGPLRPTLWICLCLLLLLTGCCGWTWDMTDCLASFRTDEGPWRGHLWLDIALGAALLLFLPGVSFPRSDAQ